ncbi:MAG: hypothetical protein ACK5LT_13095 [Lachnospirales bacterium]
MTENEKEYLKYKREKYDLVSLILTSTTKFLDRDFQSEETAGEAYVNLINKREERIIKCKDIDIKINNLDEDTKNSNCSEILEMNTKTANLIKEIVVVENKLSATIEGIRSSLGKSRASVKNRMKINNGYFLNLMSSSGRNFDSKR